MATKRRGRKWGRQKAARRATKAQKAFAKVLTGAIALLVGTALVALAWLMILYPRLAAPGRGRTVRFEIEGGADLALIAEGLRENEVIQHPTAFAAYARLLGAADHMREGAIWLSDDMTPRDVLQRIADGYGAAVIRVTIPEGFDRFAIADRLSRWEVVDRDAFLAATEDVDLLAEFGIPGPSAEGYLFPDTYRFSQAMGAREIVRRMVANGDARLTALFEAEASGLVALEETLSWGRQEALILASIVEKEAAVAEEREIIARVFINRLVSPEFRPKRLQADPTVAYGCRMYGERVPSCARFEGRLSRAMLRDAMNPYNTYRVEGLPPGPICNPGLASIRAVLTARVHNYFYFVARGEGRHDFSETLAEHNAAVARYRARQGR